MFKPQTVLGPRGFAVGPHHGTGHASIDWILSVPCVLTADSAGSRRLHRGAPSWHTASFYRLDFHRPLCSNQRQCWVPAALPPGPSLARGRLLYMDSHCPLCSNHRQCWVPAALPPVPAGLSMARGRLLYVFWVPATLHHFWIELMK